MNVDSVLANNELVEFVPKMIGREDLESREKIKSLYSELANRASVFVWDTQDLLNNQELKVEIFFELMKMNDKDLVLYLKREYVKANKISIPGINMEKLISADLVDLPNDYDSIVTNWKETNEPIDKIKETKFFFPLSKLSNSEGGQFDLNEEFDKELLNFTSSWTENEKQNEVLTVVENFCDAINDLIQLNLVKKQGALWTNAIEVLKMGIVNNESSDRPLSPERDIFKKYWPLERFGNKELFNVHYKNRQVILS